VTDQQKLQNEARGKDPLPLEPDSTAEILAATHLFTVETLAVETGSWVRGNDGLEHRPLRFRVRLLENLKGALDIEPGKEIDAAVEQKRESALVVSDYHGFWSHNEPRLVSRYLVISGGAGRNPVVLMEEPNITALLDGSLAADVHAAIEAEQQFGATGGPQADAPRLRQRALALLQFAFDHRRNARGLFGRYVWARVAPLYSGDENALRTSALAIVEVPDATLELRDAVIDGLYRAVLSLGPTPERSAMLLRPLLGLTLQAEAAPLMDRLLQGPIYNLVFRPTGPHLRAAEVVPDAAERARMATKVAGYRPQRARDIRLWLEAN
jgi:hypothetical protein